MMMAMISVACIRARACVPFAISLADCQNTVNYKLVSQEMGWLEIMVANGQERLDLNWLRLPFLVD